MTLPKPQFFTTPAHRLNRGKRCRLLDPLLYVRGVELGGLPHVDNDFGFREGSLNRVQELLPPVVTDTHEQMLGRHHDDLGGGGANFCLHSFPRLLENLIRFYLGAPNLIHQETLAICLEIER